MARPDYRPGLRTRIVGFLKIALPLLAVALLSTVFLFQESDQIEGGITFSSDDRDTMRDGLAIYNPKFSGINLNGDRFFMEASKATPDGADPNEVELVDLNGRTEFRNGSAIYLKAARGTARLPQQIIDLYGGVHIRTSDGFEMLTNAVIAGLETGSFISDTPVTLSGPIGQLEAGSMRIEQLSEDTNEENQVFTFENGVTLTLTPN